MSSNINNLLPDITTLQLREADNKEKDDPAGQFSVNLKKPVVLNNNDVCEVSQVFLDTQNNDTGLIQLQNDDGSSGDVTIKASFGYYVTNIPTTNEGIYRGNDASDLPPIVASKNYVRADNAGIVDNNNEIDGLPYVACYKRDEADPNNNAININEVRIQLSPQHIAYLTNPISKKTENRCIASFLITYRDISNSNDIIQKYIINDTRNKGDTTTKFILDNFLEGQILVITNEMLTKVNQYVKDKNQKVNPIGSFTQFPLPARKPVDLQTQIELLAESGNNPGDLDFGSNNTRVITSDQDVAGTHYNPIINEVSITLPSGTYTPSEITQRISLGFTNVNEGGDVTTGSFNVINNPLLKSSKELMVNAVGQSDNQEVHYVKATNGDKKFQFTSSTADATTPNYFVGSSQFGLVYDQVSNKYSIDLLHTSLLDQSQDLKGGLPESRIYKTPLNDIFAVGSYSGVYLTDLRPHNLWFGQMKFDSEKLIVNLKNQNVNYNSIPFSVPVFSSANNNELVVGQNITAEDSGIDEAVIKARSGSNTNVSANTQTFELAPPLVEAPEYLATTTSDHVGIFSKGIINNENVGHENEGYYLIEIECGIQQKLNDSITTNNKIQAIVSRYYSAGSFCAFEGGNGSLTYVHKGETPLILDSFRCRILSPDGTLASDINTNNTIFLKITKTK